MVKYVVKKGDRYWPSKAMKDIALVDKKIYKESQDPRKFWAKLARRGLVWNKKWDKVYEEKLPYFKWFKGGELNFSYNCLDRNLFKKGNKTALIFVPEPIDEKPIKWTYHELYQKVCKFSNVLRKHGIVKGDIVSIYLPLIPEALVAMLACTRIGAIHSVVFSAFSSDALKSRIQDGKAKLLITADGYYRRGEKVDLLKKAKKAVYRTSVKKVIVVPRLRKSFRSLSFKFKDFNKEMDSVGLMSEPVSMKSEDPLFILYTSGTTGKPKGVVHDTGGYAVYAKYTCLWNFNLLENDVLWCTADIGWITGHTYAFYGPLLNGSTTLIYEGSPDFPKIDRWWKIIEKHNVSAFYTAPTAIRMFMKAGDKYLKKHRMKSLKVLGSVGEPIDKDAWNWYFKKIGKGRCPIIDTWWQTETGGTLINVLPGVGPFVPTVAGKSFPGTKHLVVDDKGKIKKGKDIGFLVQEGPFAPGMLHGVYNDHKKYLDTYWRYWKKHKKKYYDSSDGAFITNGLIRITGRTDDVMKVAGHRISTAELEDAINEYKTVNECAVVPIADKIKGEVPVAFVVLKGRDIGNLEGRLKKHVDNKIGPTARPSFVYVVKDLPKTRSGKIMRRILKNVLNNEEPKGLMTLVNPDCVGEITELVKGKVNKGKMVRKR
ncbi:acetate--CoA ligase [Candidatus Pacearchaeota archaeon]|nr:acetate--CoA ligase [Candidatus Pacearchaeota archaeon]|tara:strand:+ start:3360 stop:5321 length:1962 start_codon:yes stop_codon:yes gene_type:complete